MKNTVILSLAAALMQLTAPAAQAGTYTVNKDSANHYIALGGEEVTARRYSIAWKYYETATKFDANNAEAQKGISDVCLHMNRMSPGIIALDKYCALRPADNAALIQLTKLYFNYGTWDKVKELAPKMHERIPTETSYAFMLGKAYFSEQNYGKGLEYLQEAIKLDDRNAEAFYLIAHIYTLESNYTAGLPYYRKTLMLDSVTSNSLRLYEFAMVLNTAGQFDESIAVFMKTLEKGYKARDDFYMNMAYAMADAHQTDRAVKVLDDMLVRRPNDLGVLEALADVAYHGGKYNLAISYFDKLLAIDDHNARALYQIGMSYIKLGKDTDGHSLCDKAIAMDPSLAVLRHQQNGLMQ